MTWNRVVAAWKPDSANSPAPVGKTFEPAGFDSLDECLPAGDLRSVVVWASGEICRHSPGEISSWTLWFVFRIQDFFKVSCKMRSHVVIAVFKRNFWSYFSGVIGYLFIVAFVLLGAFAAFQEKFFTNNVDNLAQLNEWFPKLLLFIIPAITMSVWSEERKLGTEELLFTLPVSDLEVLIGKFLAVVSVYSVALVFSLTHALVLAGIGHPDAGMLAANYVGYWLAGVALLSAGMMASYLTSSATVAFVLGSLICTIPVFIGDLPVDPHLAALFGSDQFFDQLSLPRQLEPLGIGLVPLKSVLYFATIVGFMLYLNLILIGQRHWRGGTRGFTMGWQYFIRGVSLALILISGNVLVANFNRTADLTAEHLYSVTKTTRDLLGKLNDKRPVMIQAFVSREVPRNYVPVKTSLLGLLGQYEQASRGNITVRISTIDPASPQADEAKKVGVEGRKVQTERAGRQQRDEVFLGVVVSSGANEVVIPFFDVGLPVEYELTRSIWTVANEKRKTIGILDNDAKVSGGFDMSSFRSIPEWRLTTELKKQYNVESVPAGSAIDESKFDVLIAVMPSSLTQNEMKNLVEYLKKGKPTLIFDDPFPVMPQQTALAPRQPKPRAGGNPMMQMQMPNEPKADGGRATSLVNALGIQWNYDEVVFDDTSMGLHPEYAELLRPEWVSISRRSGLDSALSRDSEITKPLEEVFLFYAGTIKPREGSKLEFKPLLRTGKRSGLIGWNDFITSTPFGQIYPNEDPVRRYDDDYHVIAAEITSPKDAQGDKIHAIYVADSDLISDWSFALREQKFVDLNIDNVTFALNAIDHLAGDSSYIELRSRRPKTRTLERVEEMTGKFRERMNTEKQKAADDAKKALDDARKRFNEKVEKIKSDEHLDDSQKQELLMIEERQAARRIEVEEAVINQKKEKQIEQIKTETDRNIRSVEQWFYRVALFVSPIPAFLLGLVVWSLRVSRENKEIAPTRRVSK
jgi:ABC-2 type transport system permease protein